MSSPPEPAGLRCRQPGGREKSKKVAGSPRCAPAEAELPQGALSRVYESTSAKHVGPGMCTLPPVRLSSGSPVTGPRIVPRHPVHDCIAKSAEDTHLKARDARPPQYLARGSRLGESL